jgi:hypothetical protein
MKGCIRFIKRTDSDTDRTVRSIFGPPPDALFCINRPLENVHVIGNIVVLRCTFSSFQGLAGAGFRTFLAGLAKGLNTEIHRLIRNKRQIGKDLAQPNPGPIFFSN